MPSVDVHHADESVTLWHGDCLDVLRELADCSVDSIVTDPPYGLGFMGKAWDDLPPGVEWAAECLRVLKPGGHLLAFGGSRTWHRLAAAVEDAGFEIRDSIAWLYGQGFPKSLNVGKDARFCQCGKVESPYGATEPATQHDVHGVRVANVSQAEGTPRGSGPVLHKGVSESSAPAERAMPSTRSAGVAERLMEGRRNAQEATGQLSGRALREVSGGLPDDGTSRRLHHGAPSRDGAVDRALPAAVGSGKPQGPRPVEQRPGEPGALPVERGPQAGRGGPLCAGCGKPPAPAGLGTALKPAFEPVVVGRKPLAGGTVAANVLAHGTGALNIDACRVGDELITAHGGGSTGDHRIYNGDKKNGQGLPAIPAGSNPRNGRWPANVVLDEWHEPVLRLRHNLSQDIERTIREFYGARTALEVLRRDVPAAWLIHFEDTGQAKREGQAAALDEQSGTLHPPGTSGGKKRSAVYGLGMEAVPQAPSYSDTGGASRFFYVAKAPKSERPRTDDGTSHPTVKPLALMRWLVRLVTPPGGVVLEPFAGSGTTVEACLLEGFQCIAIEREADYLPLIEARIARVSARPVAPDLPSLFDLDGVGA